MVRHLLISSFCFVLNVSAFAQYTQIGNGGFSNANFGPFRTDTFSSYYSRFAMIYPASTLGDLAHGDKINALAFQHNSFDTMRGTGLVKIYIRSTNKADFGTAALNWAAESRNGMTLVFSGDPYTLRKTSPGKVLFRFNQVNDYLWDTTGAGTNLEVLVHYEQSTKQDAPFDWLIESSFYVPGFVSANESKYLYGQPTAGMDSITIFSSLIKPTLTIYYPRYSADLEVVRMYSLGTVPILMKTPDSIKVVINNVGKDTQFNKKIRLEVSGVNAFLDSLILDSIAPFDQKFVYFTKYNPINIGTETLKVSVPKDSTISNDTLLKMRKVSYNIYSHSDPFGTSSGGIGFNGSTGDFLAKFYVQGSSYINQIKVDFSVSGNKFQLGVWKDDGPNNRPGTILFMSDTSTTVNGTFIMPVLPKIQVSGGYFVGIRQTTNTNVGFSFQYEIPIRPHSFYFAAPASDTNWVPFSPGFNFNFNIQPRLQVANDIAVSEIVSPVDGDSILYSVADSIPLRAKIINYGFQNQGNFLVRMEVLNRFSQQIFLKETITSLNADQTDTLNFGKLSLYNLGRFTARVTVLLSTDSVPDNNIKSASFDLIKNRDVGVNRIFYPTGSDSFDLNRDSFQAVIKINNYGSIAMNGFKVRGDLINNDGKVLDSDEFTISLGANLDVIRTFKYMRLTEPGNITFRAYTLLPFDSFPVNDTAKVTIYSRKVDDVSILTVVIPKAQKHALGGSLKPLVTLRNDGLKNKDSIYVFATIYGANNSVLYRDTILKSLNKLSIGQVQFKDFVKDSIGDYILEARAYIAEDQWRINDTLKQYFSVVTGNDLKFLNLLSPQGAIPVGSFASAPKLVILNNGFNAINGASVSMDIVNQSNVTVYSDTTLVSLDTLQQDTMSFKNLTFNSLGDYYIRVVNNWPLEQKPGKLDTLLTSYITRYQSDLEISKHILPTPNDTLEYNQSIKPSVQVVNRGLDTILNRGVAFTLVNKDGNVIYKDTAYVAKLAPNGTATLTASFVYSATSFGTFNYQTNLVSMDGNPSNDSLTTSYLVIKRADVSAATIVAPAIGTSVIKKNLVKPQLRVTNEGVDDLVDIVVNCRGFLNATPVYLSSTTVSLASGASQVIDFDSSLTLNSAGTVVLAFSVAHPFDQFIFNDSLFRTITFIDNVSVRSLYNRGTLVYPNPFTNTISIDAKSTIRSIRIMDMTGSLIYTTNMVLGQSISIPLEAVAGSYLLELELEHGIERYPIIKEK
jgi:hypothetical protein